MDNGQVLPFRFSGTGNDKGLNYCSLLSSMACFSYHATRLILVAFSCCSGFSFLPSSPGHYHDMLTPTKSIHPKHHVDESIMRKQARTVLSAKNGDNDAPKSLEGQMKQRQYKAASRENRILELESKFDKTKAEESELNGLLKVSQTFEEQYDQALFSKEHLEFKSMHNDAFIKLSHYCQREWRKKEESSQCSTNVFFLDGPDGGTASALIQKGGFEPSQCYVANRHKSSCKSLRASGGGLLPDQNVVHTTATEALISKSSRQSLLSILNNDDSILIQAKTGGQNDVCLDSYEGKDGPFANTKFSAYYFDGCGGYVPHMIGMLCAALLPRDEDSSLAGYCPPAIAVGYSLLGGNRNQVVNKELTITQVLTQIARRRQMRLVHVLDDPTKYGISSNIKKIGGSVDGTFTTWLLLIQK